MSEPLDYAKLELTCWRALCRHDVDKLDFLMASTIIRLSFGIGEPSLRVNYSIELAHLTGMSKGKSHDVIQRMITARAVEVSPDKKIYTFLPPSKAWPWLYGPRVRDQKAVDELETALIWANKGGPAQGELFAPSGDREFAEALHIERMREGLLEYHRAAITRFAGSKHFPAMDGTPKFPGTSSQVRGEHVSPLETGAAPIHPGAPETLAPDDSPASYYWHADGFPQREPVPSAGTPHLDALNGLVSSVPPEETENTKTLSAFNAGFSQREPDDWNWRTPVPPDADEKYVIRWLRGALGERVMEQWGGFWRNAWRDCPLAVLEAINNYKLRVQTRGDCNAPGGWLRDQYGRFRKVIKPNPTKVKS
jgi:hypothetical protein